MERHLFSRHLLVSKTTPDFPTTSRWLNDGEFRDFLFAQD